MWYFYTEPDNGGSGAAPSIPAGSLLARWQSEPSPKAKEKLAQELEKLLTSDPPNADEGPDAKLYQQLSSLGGPLFSSLLSERKTSLQKPASPAVEAGGMTWGLDPSLFGQPQRDPGGGAPALLDPASLLVHAPSVLEVRLPAELAAGCEFVTTGRLDPQAGVEGSVQLQVLTTKPGRDSGLLPSTVTETQASGPWTSDNRRIALAAPVVVNEHTQARRKFEDAFEQLWQYATQDADPKVFEPLRKPNQERAAAFRQRLIDTQPVHVQAVLEFANRAYRRP